MWEPDKTPKHHAFKRGRTVLAKKRREGCPRGEEGKKGWPFLRLKRGGLARLRSKKGEFWANGFISFLLG